LTANKVVGVEEALKRAGGRVTRSQTRPFQWIIMDREELPLEA
jgi:hypothetical protein